MTSHKLLPLVWTSALVVAALALAWLLQDVWLLVFGGIVFAAVFDRLSAPARALGAGRALSVVLTVLALLAGLTVAVLVLGNRFFDELERLAQQVPESLELLRQWLSRHEVGREILQAWGSVQERGIPWQRVGEVLLPTANAFADALLMLVLAVYLAVNPGLYLAGMVRLVPVRSRDAVRDALRDAGDGLSKWLMGQAVSMVFVGLITGVGLALIGVPLAFSLGVLAGLFEFVPFFGSIVAGALAVLVALTQGPEVGLYALALAVGVQQLEGNLLTPLVQRWAVDLPPALGIVSVVVFGMLFGFAGIIFATPLTVVLMILTRRLYVERFLEQGNTGQALER